MTAAARAGGSRWPLLTVALAGGAALAMWLTRRFVRYEVAGQSMTPSLRPGDLLIVTTHGGRAPQRGHVVLARDPREPSRVLLKRVRRVDLHGSAWLEGDNPASSTDSRTFGPLDPTLLIGRALWRYWPPGRFGPVS